MQFEITFVPWLKCLPSHWSEHCARAAEGSASGTDSENSHRILIVEDDFLVASEIETALTDAGFEIAGTAASGEEALELAHSQSPTLVVIDIRLAGDLDGIDTAIELFRAHGTRCIFASAYSDQEARRRAAPAGPLGWLQKPYSMSSLTDMVREAVRELRRRD